MSKALMIASRFEIVLLLGGKKVPGYASTPTQSSAATNAGPPTSRRYSQNGYSTSSGIR
jgi:hypothetical protein